MMGFKTNTGLSPFAYIRATGAGNRRETNSTINTMYKNKGNEMFDFRVSG